MQSINKTSGSPGLICEGSFQISVIFVAMYRLLILIALFFAVLPLRSQTTEPALTEDHLSRLFTQFRNTGTLEEKHQLNDSIINYMSMNLLHPESFTYRFDSLRKRVGILNSDDGQIRIFTWNIPMSAFQHEYHGIIQVYKRREDTCQVHVLSNQIRNIPDLLHVQTDKDMWPGALYYGIRKDKVGRNVIYTLMGFNFHERYSDKKIIEILHFDNDMNPLFGKPVFNTPAGIQHRVVFEYSGEVAMNLRYNPDLKMIVYDHLAPIEPELAEHPRFYAPDFSYDGYKFKKGFWEYQADLDVRNR